MEQEDAPCWYLSLGRPRGANLNSNLRNLQKNKKQKKKMGF